MTLCGKIQEVKSCVFFHKLKVWPNKNPFEIERSGFLGGTDLCCFAQMVGISLKAVIEWPKLTYIVDVKASKPWFISTIHQKWTKIMIFKSENISKIFVFYHHISTLQWVVFLTLRVAFFGHPTPMHLAPRSGNRPVCPLQRPRWCPTSGWWKKGGNGDWLQVRRFFNMWRR